MHQSSVANGDSYSRQFDEVWPGGRFNHYWFDLNRDYLLLVHPESRGRVEKFHEWKPNIVTDHHEAPAVWMQAKSGTCLISVFKYRLR